MNEALIEKIRELAGPQRSETFAAAARFILRHKIANPIETGTFRGCDGDGQSTVILAMLAAIHGGRLTSIDINAEHIQAARWHVAKHDLTNIDFITDDSVTALGKLQRDDVQFVYLDSFDHDPENPGPCQRHELAEMGAIYSKLKPPCAILLDDNVTATGGKTLLGAAFLKDRGWTLAEQGYQLFFTLE